MVKHIVLCILKESLPQEEKLDIMNRFKAAIEALPSKISVIRKIFVGLNCNADEKWDICLESEFDSLKDVSFYAQHPDHLAAAGIQSTQQGTESVRHSVGHEFLLDPDLL